MAQVTITIKDSGEDDEQINVSIEFHPELPAQERTDKLTPAQRTALYIVEQIQNF